MVSKPYVATLHLNRPIFAAETEDGGLSESDDCSLLSGGGGSDVSFLRFLLAAKLVGFGGTLGGTFLTADWKKPSDPSLFILGCPDAAGVELPDSEGGELVSLDMDLGIGILLLLPPFSETSD
jgi:hypothetical protein